MKETPMLWFDRFLLFGLGLGVWTFIILLVVQQIQEPVQAFSYEDLVDEVVHNIERNCSVHGEIHVYDHPYGEIDGGYLRC